MEATVFVLVVLSVVNTVAVVVDLVVVLECQDFKLFQFNIISHGEQNEWLIVIWSSLY